MFQKVISWYGGAVGGPRQNQEKGLGILQEKLQF